MRHSLFYYQVYSIIYNAVKIDVNSNGLLFANFIFPVILTLLPLSTETYGSAEGYDWCFIRERASSGTPEWSTVVWSIFCFYGWLFLNVVLYFVLLCMALRHILQMRTAEKNNLVQQRLEASLHKLVWYPLITFFVWLPSAIYDIDDLEKSYDAGSTTSYAAAYFSHLTPITHGFFICCAYFTTNSDVLIVLTEFVKGRGFLEESLLESHNRSSSNIQTESPPSGSVPSRSTVSTRVFSKDNPLGWKGDADDDVNNDAYM